MDALQPRRLAPGEMLVSAAPGDLGDVIELNSETGEMRVIAKAGSPEAEAFHATYGDPFHPVDLTPLAEGAAE